ncbi:shikimate dehydrogenase [Planctomicrobium piriforme]|uniref:Multifunctional fusion protein n=1 Tax=Planctomicrobium piriforme TaxID=1576369 RepID=A0A1I3C9A3_9PLAN|nr:shikimate dehydrogenase [Planctomicrobium piriforme]SFH70993.1 3-dehydroquinate dehydratase [Planctomicrobium piriforme]
MICVTLGRTRHKMMLAEHIALAQRGAELVELRVDWIARTPRLGELLKNRPTPTIVTCRRPDDGGRFGGQEDQRQTLLREAIAAGVEYVDLEEDLATSVRRYGKTKRIVSYHNFNETPDNLEEIHARLAKLDADIVKVVTMANSPVDNVRVLQLVKNAKIPTVGFCMGEYGVVSRILCGKFGAPFTYCTFSKERVMAPGQLPFDEMKKLYRFDEINADTAVFGVVGDPIGHSWSPLLHNSAFKRSKMNAVYLPIRVPPENFEETLKAFEALGVRGYSVTIPHKQAALEFADHADDASKEIGAANTLFKDTKGQWCAANTDLPAAMASIQIGLDAKTDKSLNGKRVLILGAGGAARAIGLGASRAGASVMIANRSKERGTKLAEELKCQFVTWANRGAHTADVIVNCTPLGMFPEMNATPYEQYWFRDGTVAFDTVYNPESTMFLKEAREHRCIGVSGIEMFIRQAAEQFKHFTGRDVSLDDLRTTLRRAISPVRVKTETGHAAPTEATSQEPSPKPNPPQAAE